MGLLKLRLDRLPADIENLRRFARRSDGADGLPPRITKMGFGLYANAGDVVDCDLSAIGLTAAAIPPEVSIVKQLRVLARVPSGQHPDFNLQEPGALVMAPQSSADWAVASGVAEVV